MPPHLARQLQDALLRPLRDGDGLLLDALRLGERIRELERMVDNAERTNKGKCILQ